MKIIFLFISLLVSFNAFSDFKKLSCPDSILCSNDICKYYNAHEWVWYKLENNESFKGAKRMFFSGSLMKNFKEMMCFYSYGDRSSIILMPERRVLLPTGMGWDFDDLKKMECTKSSGVQECGVIVEVNTKNKL